LKTTCETKENLRKGVFELVTVEMKYVFFVLVVLKDVKRSF